MGACLRCLGKLAKSSASSPAASGHQTVLESGLAAQDGHLGVGPGDEEKRMVNSVSARHVSRIELGITNNMDPGRSLFGSNSAGRANLRKGIFRTTTCTVDTTSFPHLSTWPV